MPDKTSLMSKTYSAITDSLSSILNANIPFMIPALWLFVILSVSGCGGGGSSSSTGDSSSSGGSGSTPAKVEKTYDNAYGGSMTVSAVSCSGLYGTWNATVNINNSACGSTASATYQWELSSSSQVSPYEWSVSYDCVGVTVMSSHTGLVSIDGGSLKFDETSLESVCPPLGNCVNTTGEATESITVEYGSASGC